MKMTRLVSWHMELASVFLAVSLCPAISAVPQLASGPYSGSSFLIDANGILNSWGNNTFGLLGIGSYLLQPTPTTVAFPAGVSGWKVVVSGGGFSGSRTLAIADNGQLYGAGLLEVPPYGYQIVPDHLSLIPDPEGSGWTSAAVMGEAWLALTANGKLYGWTTSSGPIQYPPPPTGTGWSQVAFGDTDVLTLANNGRLFRKNRLSLAAAFTEVTVPAGATAWTNISCGSAHSLALADDGNLYSWGENAVGQLGIGAPPLLTNTPQLVLRPAGVAGWRAISCGWNHSLALTTGGEVYVWGYNHKGQLGLGNTLDQTSPTRIPSLTNVTAIAAGHDHSLVVAGCMVWAWGRNTQGALGTGATSSFELSPVMALFNYDICSTNLSELPNVSIAALDAAMSETTYRAYPFTNTALFQISRLSVGDLPLVVNYSIGGTASNGVDYVQLPGSITIPANSNPAAALIVPIQDSLTESPETINITLLPDPAYTLGSTTNALITLIEYESPPPPPIPPLRVPVAPDQPGQVITIQASTNLVDWTPVATVTNTAGVVSFTETNAHLFKSRFFRAVTVPNP